MPIRRLLGPAVLVCVLAALAAVAVAAPASAGFFGVVTDRDVLVPGRVDLDRELRLMRQNGVSMIRVRFDWGVAQPFAKHAHVPRNQRSKYGATVGGRPTSFAATDRIVGAAARAGVDVLPVPLGIPGWAANGFNPRVPGSPAQYGSYVGGLVRRYGPNGTFWKRGGPKRPIRTWQIWNEPASYYGDNFGPGYVDLLRGTSPVIRSIDPGATIVSAAVYGSSQAIDLQKIYAQPGAAALFDVAAIHPFVPNADQLPTVLRGTRNAMNAWGDAATPIWITELTWPASVGRIRARYGYETTANGQRDRIRKGFAELYRRRAEYGLAKVIWYSWLTGYRSSRDVFDYSGLRRTNAAGRITNSPSLAAFRGVARGR